MYTLASSMFHHGITKGRKVVHKDQSRTLLFQPQWQQADIFDKSNCSVSYTFPLYFYFFSNTFLFGWVKRKRRIILPWQQNNFPYYKCYASPTIMGNYSIIKGLRYPPTSSWPTPTYCGVLANTKTCFIVWIQEMNRMFSKLTVLTNTRYQTPLSELF